jgi:hypothetical protein
MEGKFLNAFSLYFTEKATSEVLKQPSATTTFIVVGKNVSASKLQAIEKRKMKTKTEKEFMELIKPAPVVEKPTPVAKPLPKKSVTSQNRKSSPVEEDQEAPTTKSVPSKLASTKKAVPVKKRASSPADSEDDVPSKPAAKKNAWNRPTGDNTFDTA